MILCVAGDIHGALDRMYGDILAFEAALSVRFDWVLHVGDFGVWPDASRIDGATRRHEGDFPAWAAERRSAPRPTVFIKGNHEDFVWLDAQPSAEVLPDLFYLRNGQVQELRAGDFDASAASAGASAPRISSVRRPPSRGMRRGTTRATRSPRFPPVSNSTSC
jgi:predicted phosphodiesterase